MNSAAKLRTRGIAAIGATALVATAFGPAAMAWTGSAITTAANTAGAASIGLIDADDAKTGTQGARVVTPGASNQEIGDIRFVVPSTWQAGDTLTFTVGNDGTAVTVDDRVSFSSLPAVNIDTKAYNADTHVQATSPSPVSAAAAGSVEAGREAPYSGSGTPVAPTFTTRLGTGSGTGQFQNRITIEFTNNSDPLVNGAKFIGAINGPKVNVGANVAANRDLGVTMAHTAATGSGAGNPISSGANYTTYPATIANVGMTVANGSVVADGSYQYVGPVTVSSAVPFNGTSPVAFSVDTGTFDPGAKITATQYNAAGTVIGTPTAGNAALSGGNKTVTFTPASTAVRVVFSGMAMNVTRGTQLVNYTLTGSGQSASPLSGSLGSSTTVANNFAVTPADTARTQTDIERPSAVTQAQVTTTVIPQRIGGANRYETAVKIAEADRGADSVVGARGEADNVVIASGEAFPDALSAGYLAATKDAPILLTQKGQLPSTVIEFLKNYGAKNVFIVGGSAAVSDRVEAQLRDLQSYDIQAKQQTQQRQVTVNSGSYATSAPAAAADAAGSTANLGALTYTDQASVPGNLVLTATYGSGTTSTEGLTTLATTSTGFSVGSFTVSDGNASAPVTFTRPDGSTQVVTVTLPAVMDRSDTTPPTSAQTFTFAPTNSASQLTKTETVPNGFTDTTAYGDARMVVPLNAKLQVTRIGGFNRFDTNRRVNEYAGATSATPIGTMVAQYGQPGKKTALLANGLTPWDSLAAGPLVGNGGGNPVPLVLTMGDKLHDAARDQMQTMDIGHAILIGGEAVIPASVAGNLSSVNTTSTRLAGPSRFETAKAIAEFAMADSTPSASNTNPGLDFGAHAPILANGGFVNMTTPDSTKWADALAAGAWAARDNRIIALTSTQVLPDPTKELLTKFKADFSPLTAVGLGFAVSTEVLNAANALVAD